MKVVRMRETRMTVRSFTDLDVYKLLYKAGLLVHKEILPNLPESEKYSLYDQINRAWKAPLALIAEGYAKKNHKKDWQLYIDRAIGECNEMIVHLSLSRDLYEKRFKQGICDELIEMYNITGKQLYRLGQSWNKNRD